MIHKVYIRSNVEVKRPRQSCGCASHWRRLKTALGVCMRGEWGEDGGEREHALCLGSVYMWPLFDLPLLETLFETGVGFDAGPVSLHKGKRELV